MAYSIFNQEINDTLKEPMFFGDSVNVARFDQQKFEMFEKLTEKQLSFFWRPEEIDVSKDKIDSIKTIQESERSTIEGIYSPFRRFGLDLSEKELIVGWPKIVQELDFDTATSDLGTDLKKVVIQLSASSKHALEPIWQPAEFNPSRHFGYAVQWFGLALVLMLSYIYFGFKKDEDGF